MESGGRNKIIVILGPTASGKSDVAITLAKKFDGEIISADSRQIYRRMNIGTGKVIGTWDIKHRTFVSEGIPHHLIDVADPNEEFNISHFKKLAEKAIEEILQKGKLPIICGGTGFWIKSIIDDVKLPEVKPNTELRRKLERNNAEELFIMLKKLDPERAQTIDAKNKVRLVRAIEIAKELGKVPKMLPVIGHRSSVKHNFLQIGIDVPKEVLNAKIKKRLDERFKQGMVEEVDKLHSEGVSWQRLEYFGLEYRWIARYLQNKITLDEMKEKLYFDIIHYAKRQLTWFKKDKRILWLKAYAEIEKTVAEFIKS